VNFSSKTITPRFQDQKDEDMSSTKLSSIPEETSVSAGYISQTPDPTTPNNKAIPQKIAMKRNCGGYAGYGHCDPLRKCGSTRCDDIHAENNR
jgi:hypothetical protein